MTRVRAYAPSAAGKIRKNATLKAVAEATFQSKEAARRNVLNWNDEDYGSAATEQADNAYLTLTYLSAHLDRLAGIDREES